jgi:Raf kinase inhibitor-like YbhB/YbcL family protein
MKKMTLLLAVVGIIGGSVCAKGSAVKKGTKIMDTIKIESAAFKHLQPIPSQYTCDGADISPPLSWNGVPAGTKSLALIAEDPDAPAGTWVHWVVYDLPPATDSLQENLPKTDTLAGGGKQGKTDFNRIGWNGPCPPGGNHRYFFNIYALDIMLNLPAGKTKAEIEKAMNGHILAKGELVGTYKRKQ